MEQYLFGDGYIDKGDKMSHPFKKALFRQHFNVLSSIDVYTEAFSLPWFA